VWNLALTMALFVFRIGFIQNIMELLVDVLNLFNEFGFLISPSLSMGIVILVWMQEEELHEWGPMVETLIPTKRDCG
jgi:hypothetical protein